MHAVPPLEQDTGDATVDVSPPQTASQKAAHAPGQAANDAPVRDLRRVGIHPDYWYPLAWSHEVKRGKTHGVTFAGDPIVLARTEGGKVFALEDRCAHRQVPLHQGVVDGESIRCGYHGWTYDCSGKCIDVPYLGRDRLPNGVRSYPCREVEGLIFVFPGDAALAERRPMPDLGSVSDTKYKTRRFGRPVNCHYSFMHENLMDMNHQFLHRKQMGQMRARSLGRRRGEGWVEVDRRSDRVRPEPQNRGRQRQGRDDDPHRISVSDAADPHVRADVGDESVDRLRAARS
jgi:phenylpropionate dioxygenase-like ring-hydroxylating dioxygenase large terminal subunit